MRSITGVADRAGSPHPPGTPESIPGFQYRSCHLIFSFWCCVLSTIVCTHFSFYLTLHWPSFKFQLLITSFVSFIGHYIGRPSNCSFWLPHLYLLLDITLAVLQIVASDYLICIFYWTLHWPSFKLQLLITSFVSFIGHYIDRHSNSSFWLPHLYLLLDITLAVIQIPASDYLICIFYWTLHWPSFKFQLLITSFVSFIGHYIGRPSNCSFWLPHLYLLLDITLAVIQIPASDYLICIFYWT
jgi:hypothetical protein